MTKDQSQRPSGDTPCERNEENIAGQNQQAEAQRPTAVKSPRSAAGAGSGSSRERERGGAASDKCRQSSPLPRRHVSPRGRRSLPLGKRPLDPRRHPSPPDRRPRSPGRHTPSAGRGRRSPGRRPSPPGRRPSSPGRRPPSPGRRPPSPGRRPSSPGRRPSSPGRDPRSPQPRHRRPLSPPHRDRPVTAPQQRPDRNLNPSEGDQTAAAGRRDHAFLGERCQPSAAAAARRDETNSRDRGGREDKGSGHWRDDGTNRYPRARQSSRERDNRSRVQQLGVAPAVEYNAFEILDKFLTKHTQLKEVVSPNNQNVSIIHLRSSDFVTFVGVQKWLTQRMGLHLQLLPGTFVLCPAEDIPLPGDAVDAERAAVPLRLRQVAAVQTQDDAEQVDASDIVVLLEGGGEVRASRLSYLTMEELPDNEELCCELASLQLQELMPLMNLYGLAHTIWRLKLCNDLEGIIQDFEKEQADLRAKGMDSELLEMAATAAENAVRTRMQQLPKANFVDEVLQYIILIPGGPTLLQQQLRAEAARWQEYLQLMLSLLAEQRQPQSQLLTDDAPMAAPTAGIAGIDRGFYPGSSSGDKFSLQQPPYQDYQQQQQGFLQFEQQGFQLGTEVEESGMFDDPTGLGGLGGLSPLEPQTMNETAFGRPMQAQGSLGYGMGTNHAAANSGMRSVLSTVPGRAGALQQQQQQLPGLGTASGGSFGSGMAAVSGGLLQKSDVQALMSKYDGGGVQHQSYASSKGPATTTSQVASAAAAAASSGGSLDYNYWVTQGDITAAELNPALRNAPAHFHTTTTAKVFPGRGFSGLPPGLGPNASSIAPQQQQQQQHNNSNSERAALKGDQDKLQDKNQRGERVTVLDRLGPQPSARQQQQDSGRDCHTEHGNNKPHGDAATGGNDGDLRGSGRSSRQRAATPDGHSNRGKDRGRSREAPDRPLSAVDRGRDRDRDRDRGRDRDRDRDRGIDRDRDRGIDRDMDRGIDRDMDRGIDRDRNKRSKRQDSKAMGRDRGRDRSRSQDRYRDPGNLRVTAVNQSSSRGHDTESKRNKSPSARAGEDRSAARGQEACREGKASRQREQQKQGRSSRSPVPGHNSKRTRSKEPQVVNRRQLVEASPETQMGPRGSTGRAYGFGDALPSSAGERNRQHGKATVFSGGRKGKSKANDGREPSPGLTAVLKRLLPVGGNTQAAPQAAPATAALPLHRRRSRSRSRSISKSRGRPRSRSPGLTARDGRPSKLGRLAPKDRSGHLAGPASPAPFDSARRRFEGRLEGADKLFSELSAEAAIRQWLHQMSDLIAAGEALHEDGRCFRLKFIQEKLPIPNEAVQAWGSVFQFLSRHPALIWKPTRKLLGLREGIDVDALDMLPEKLPLPAEQRTGERWTGSTALNPVLVGAGHPGFRGPTGGESGFRDRNAGGREFERDCSARLREHGSLGFRDASSPGLESRKRPSSRSEEQPSPPDNPEEKANLEFQEMLSSYASMLRQSLAEAPNHGMDLDEAYGLLPPQLREKIHPGGPVDLPKVLADHIGGVEVIHSQGRTIVQAIPPGAPTPWTPRHCVYWDVTSWGGCKKGRVCDFKHDLLPQGFKNISPTGWL